MSDDFAAWARRQVELLRARAELLPDNDIDKELEWENLATILEAQTGDYMIDERHEASYLLRSIQALQLDLNRLQSRLEDVSRYFQNAQTAFSAAQTKFSELDDAIEGSWYRLKALAGYWCKKTNPQ